MFASSTRTRRTRLFTAVCTAAVSASAAVSHAAGLLVADGGFGGTLSVAQHDVHVTINNGIATTTVDQVFRNTENRVVEALYTFPVPKGASVSNFSMWINGKEMVGEVVEKKRAREIYDSYKQQKRDPGLLEQVDYRTFEMRIFPIAANAEQHVQITYSQELDFDHDRATYVYPLATTTRPGVDAKTEGRFSVAVDVKSEIPITSLESTSHANDFVVANHNDNYRQASLEVQGGGDLSRDVVLSFETSRPRTGLDLITSKPKDEDGYFSLTLTPGEELAKFDQPMDYVFVLDVSGSMQNDGKLAKSEKAVTEFVNALGPNDRFELMSFNVQPTLLFQQLTPADDPSKARAAEFLSQQRAAGGTVLKNAMGAAYKYADASGDRPLNVVILSDGLTEQNELTNLIQLTRQRPKNTRVFSIGVGNDVNRGLLEQLASDSGGLAAFISGEDNLQRQAQAFRRKLLRPIATDVALHIDGVDVYDLQPATLPNLYYGSPVRVYGRYKNGGQAKVTVNASAAGRPLKQTVPMEFPTSDPSGDNAQIERMWALKKVDQLQKQGDANGSRDKVIPEIVRLGEGYSIVTEYTSFLVLENDGEYQRWKIDRRNATRIARDRAAQERVASALEKMRDEASANLGPAAVEKLAKPVAMNVDPLAAAKTPTPNLTTPPVDRQPPRRMSETPQNRDLVLPIPSLGGGGGGGAFGTVEAALTVAAAMGVAFAAGRLRKQNG